MRDLLRLPPAAARDRLTRDHDLDGRAADTCSSTSVIKVAVARALPDQSTILVERVRDELGDWRVCLLSPRGGRMHAPWAMAAAANIRESTSLDVDTLWGDDGFVVRFPEMGRPPDPRLLLPDPDDVQSLVLRQLGTTALFAAKFRENAARSLLLPKRRPGLRTPLWQQRKRAADLLAVASRYGSFPVLLETYRECLRDFFDMPALIATLSDLRSGKIRVVTVDSERPSPFAASLLFSYVASFLYDGGCAARRTTGPGARRRPGSAAGAARRRRASRITRCRRHRSSRAAAPAARREVPRQKRRRRARHAARHRGPHRRRAPRPGSDD